MRKLLLMFTVCLLVTIASAQWGCYDMMGLAEMQKGVRSKRVSSYDTMGGNRDHLTKIKPGERKVLFDVKGDGRKPVGCRLVRENLCLPFSYYRPGLL